MDTEFDEELFYEDIIETLMYEEDFNYVRESLHYIPDDMTIDDMNIKYLHANLNIRLFETLLDMMLNNKKLSASSYNTVLYLIKYNIDDDLIFDFIERIMIHPSKDYKHKHVPLLLDNDRIRLLFTHDRINRLIPLISDYELLDLITTSLGYTKFSSNRIRESIKQFHCDFNKCRGHRILNDDILVSDRYMSDKAYILESNIDIPATRYEYKGSGIYNINTREIDIRNYCGTFYYYEPESIYSLKSSKTLFAVNKMYAYNYLMTNTTNIMISNLNTYVYNFDMLSIKYDAHVNISFNDYMRLTVNNRIYHSLLDMTRDDYDFSTSKRHLYASEDDFDQPLCKIAKSLDLDAIVLMRMQGKKRIVSEVLDVRDRLESYNNICCTEL